MLISITHNGRVFSNFEHDDLLARGIPAPIIMSAVRTLFSNSIDTAAGNARAAFVSLGSYIDQEYLLAKQEAQTWLDGSKSESDVPSSVEDHMAMFDVSAEMAAKAIVATAEQWEQALAAIRRVRLGGKTDVRGAETIEAAEVAAQEAIATLNDIRPQEGAL